VCERCERTFETFAARGIHMRRCDGGAWRCGWCESKYEAKSGKGPGPEGPGTRLLGLLGDLRGGEALFTARAVNRHSLLRLLGPFPLRRHGPAAGAGAATVAALSLPVDSLRA